MSHCESATTRCNISRSAHYKEFLNEISGGLLNVMGYRHDNMTVMYETNQNVQW